MSERWEEIRDEINNVHIPLPASGDTRWDRLGIAAKRIAAAEKVVEKGRVVYAAPLADHDETILLLGQAIFEFDNTPKGVGDPHE